VRDCAVNGRKTAGQVERRFRALVKRFGADCRVSAIDVAAVDDFKATSLEDAKPATISRELAALGRGFRLAVKGGRIARRPDLSLLEG
jgi:hypothetical protein